MKNHALQQQIQQQLARQRLMDSLNRNTMTSIQSNLQMRLPTSVQIGQPITTHVNGAPKKQFQPPPPTSIPETPADIDIDTESKKSLLEVSYSPLQSSLGF